MVALLLLIPLTISAQNVFLHKLDWAGDKTGITGYKVYRNLNNAQWLLLAQTTNQTYTFTNTQPAAYRYRVSSYNQFGESLPSNEVGVDMRAPPGPTNLTLQVIIPVNQSPER